MDLLNFDELDEHLRLGGGAGHVVGAPLEAKPDRTLAFERALERLIVLAGNLAHCLQPAIGHVTRPSEQLVDNVSWCLAKLL